MATAVGIAPPVLQFQAMTDIGVMHGDEMALAYDVIPNADALAEAVLAGLAETCAHCGRVVWVYKIKTSDVPRVSWFHEACYKDLSVAAKVTKR